MPVMGPTYSDDEVNKIYEDVMTLLREKYHIQSMPEDMLDKRFLGKDFKIRRQERNDFLKFTIEKLVELESWECF